MYTSGGGGVIYFSHRKRIGRFSTRDDVQYRREQFSAQIEEGMIMNSEENKLLHLTLPKMYLL
jgi:hypothetical protein